MNRGYFYTKWKALFLTAVVLKVILDAGTACGGGYDFDDGGIQGWTVRGPFVFPSNEGPLSSNFSSGWSDRINYPQTVGEDPIGDSQGSQPDEIGINLIQCISSIKCMLFEILFSTQARHIIFR